MSDDINRSKNFCRFLDHGLVYNNDSVKFTVAPCCYFSHADSLDLHRDVAAQIKIARQGWQTADWNSTCAICIAQENSGQISYRQASFDMVPDDSQGVVVLTVAVNKQCNLACASCGPEFSSFWFQQNTRDGIVHPKAVINLHRNDRSEALREKFVSTVQNSQFDNVRYIKFGGGEPLMSSTHEKILELVKNPSLVTVQYTSNFSIQPSTRVFDIWSKFRLIKWCASIDGTGDQFELLRWPYRWPDLERMISDMKSRVPHNVMFGVEHTLNPLNVWYFDRFQAWFDQHLAINRYGDPSDLNFHRCFGALDLTQTPPDLRRDLEIRVGSDNAVVRFLDQHPYSGSHDRLIMWMNELDQRRGHDWRKTFSEVSAYFS